MTNYNLTNVTDANNYFEILKAVNDLSDGLIGVFIITSIFLLLMIVFKQYEQDTKETLLMASAITTLISVLFWTIGLISWTIMIYPIIALFASIVIYKFTDS